MSGFQPGYLELFHSGELKRRVEAVYARLESCDICPRRCRVNRLKGETAFCRSGLLPIVASCCVHKGEEPPISGTRGSGTIFFTNCTMRCVYCQNHQISQPSREIMPKEVSIETLAEKMLELQGQGCHNINFVTPTHFVPQIVKAVLLAVPGGLKVPLVYNTSGYESVDVVKLLDGIVDIYLPDLRYTSDTIAQEFSQTPQYVMNARAAIKEMYRQVGDLQLDRDGIAERGLIVRHLILPERQAGSRESLKWLAGEVSPSVAVSIMSQYYPANRAAEIPGLCRKITADEYSEVVDLVNDLGMENGWLQEMEAAETYRPDFFKGEHPFEK